jgi:type II secretory pathway pseudopilin PulG
VVLVLIAALTLLVFAQLRRNASTQRLAVNSTQYLQAETAAQTALRFCEAAMLTSVGEPNSVRVTTPGVRGTDVPAWRDATKWTNSSVNFGTSTVALPGVTNYECLYEDATADLVMSELANDVNLETGAANPLCTTQPGASPRLCKYRVTVRVTLAGGQQLLMQSEVRFAI